MANRDISHYLDAIKRLNVNRSGGHASPHKPCMLLAVIELAEVEKLYRNRIRFDDVLLTRYAAYFNIVKTDKDHPNPWMPFFHLKSEKFWHHQALPGKSSILQALETATQRGDIIDNIDYVSLDEELYRFLKNAETRSSLREQTILYWFSDHEQELFELARIAGDEEQLLIDAEKNLRDQRIPQVSRSAAFRRLVTEAYGFRCAASGWRVVLPDYTVLVEAAHIIPFSETQDDRPQNGIALTPNFHWAMDKNIIAPGPDMKWHVSQNLDERIADNQPIIDIDGKDLLLPQDDRFTPDPAGLEWRLSHLQ
jgi:putative restriction endonuclease